MADWNSARAVADELADTGVDPLDLQAAQMARVALLRRFALDLVLIFGIVGVVAAVALMLFRAIQGGDPTAGSEVWIGSAALLLILIVVAARAMLPARAQAYETAWAAFAQKVWPGSAKGDELGRARLAFVRRAASGDGAFPSVAPGRKA